MPFPPRVQYAGAWHHVTNRGADRQAIFRDDRDRLRFLDLLEDVVERYEIEIHAFCLMGNHYHLLVHTPAVALDRSMQLQGSRYTIGFNQRHGRDGPLFRGRYRSKLIDSESYLVAASRYIHRNPIELGVRDLASYRWSSYRAFLGRSRTASFVRTETLLELVGGPAVYRGFVEMPLRTEVDIEFECEEDPDGDAEKLL